jgi:catechol 2,3-dioxygenase-like lactoylglutathione lyase family enzyme
MIDGLDHIVLAAPSPDAAIADYEAVLGRRAD